MSNAGPDRFHSQDIPLQIATPLALRWLILAMLTIQFAILAFMFAAGLAFSTPLQVVVLIGILLFYLYFMRVTLNVNSWLSGTATRDGLHLPAKKSTGLVLVPWTAIGTIAPGRVGLVIHGLHLQLLDEALGDQLANTMRDSEGRLWIRLPTQLMNRTRLLQRIEALRATAA